jgi:CcmD family protein
MHLLHRCRLVTLAVLLCAAPLGAEGPQDVGPPPGLPPLTSPDGPGEQRELRLPNQDRQPLKVAWQKPPDGFEPISELPPDERLPAAPMLVAAYAFVVLALFAYLLSLARRLGAVKQEIARLEADLKRSGRP